MDFANLGMPERLSWYDTPHPVVAHHTAKFSWLLPESHRSAIPGKNDGVAYDVRQHVFVKYSGNMASKLLHDESEGCLTSIVWFIMSRSFVL